MSNLPLWWWLAVAFLIFVGVAQMLWRANMMMNHPEKYDNFREREKEYLGHRNESMKKAATGAVVGTAKAAVFVARLLKK